MTRQSGVERKDAKEEDEGKQKGGVGMARLLCDHIREGAITQAELADSSLQFLDSLQSLHSFTYEEKN